MRARRRFVELLREISGWVVSSDAEDDEFVALSRALERIRDRLRGHARRANDARVDAEHGISYDHMIHFNPVSGAANPVAPPVRITRLEDRVIGEVVYGPAYEGAPGHVHGGHVAAGFDDLLGITHTLAAMPALTARLTIRYRVPVPIETPLRFEGRVTSFRGRKISTAATLHAGETLLAEAEGLFILVDPRRFEDWAKARNRRTALTPSEESR